MTKILIVEDNEMNRDMLSRRLKRKGFSIVMAEDGKKGVDMSKSENPDLILMDLSLPVMDGWEATSTIKGNPETKNIPIIVLTAHAMAGDREKALEKTRKIFDTTLEIFVKAEEENITTNAAALKLAKERIQQAKN